MFPSVGHKSELAEEKFVQFLESLPLFGKLSVDSLKELSTRCVFWKFYTGQTILEENVEDAPLYIIYSGEVEVTKLRDEGTSKNLSSLGRGDHFAELSLIRGEPTSAKVTTTSACEVIIIPRPTFDELLNRYPDLYQQLAKSILDILVEKEKKDPLDREKTEQYASLAGKSSALQKATEDIKRISNQSPIIYIHGEKGVGKEVSAYLSHKESDRGDKPFITIDCGESDEVRLEKIFFGDRPFPGDEEGGNDFNHSELVNGGTILLKNVDLLPPREQENLKTLIQKGDPQFPGDADLKLIMTSRTDLKTEAEKGNFNQGLYSLLEKWSVKIPPLRERKRDIPALIGYFVEKCAAKMDKPVEDVDSEVMEKLLSYDYSLANIQELEEIIHTSIILADGDTIRTEHLAIHLQREILDPSENILTLVAHEDKDNIFIQLVTRVPEYRRESGQAIIKSEIINIYRDLIAQASQYAAASRGLDDFEVNKKKDLENFGMEIHKNLINIGRELYDIFITEVPRVSASLMNLLAHEPQRSLPRRLKIQAFGPLSNYPWELLDDGEGFLCLRLGMARLASSARYSGWSQGRYNGVLLVGTNPANDLTHVEEETQKIAEELTKIAGMRVEILTGPKATSHNILKTLDSRDFQVLHFSGHSTFDYENPEVSHLLCENETIITAYDLLTLSKKKSLQLVFLNSCFSGITKDSSSIMGLSDAFARTGVPNVIGLQCAVSDKGASALSNEFYRNLILSNNPVESLRIAREEVGRTFSWSDPAWAAPILYTL